MWDGVLPQADVRSLQDRLNANPDLIILDVREPYETSRVSLPFDHVRYTPVSLLARQGTSALPQPAQDKEAEILVMCHHGIRSADVTAWLLAQGWQNVVNLTGGIDAYALLVDPSVGRY